MSWARQIVIILFIACGLSFCSQSQQDAPSDSTGVFQQQRLKMVQSQIEARGISDPGVLGAMRKVERHRFVPEQYQKDAYSDYPLPIGEDQTISQPYIVALMTELLDIDSMDKVLEIGTGSGYQAALLAELADSVFTIEIIEPLCRRADSLLESLGYSNISVMCGDGYNGWAEHAPYDAVIVTCAPPSIPQPLIDQLADKGRLVVPVGTHWQQLLLVTKSNGKTTTEEIIPVRFVPMTGEASENR
ncbi:MAG: protein-L-isoaspartate(D-aspartate) O-methyltransferase [Candidatus Zixiibacteriota bacterium]